MGERHLSAPRELLLPDRMRACYVEQSDPPRYTLDGAAIAVDVLIPDDLAASGWFWWGSYLTQRYPDVDGAPWVKISTGTFPPPGWPGARQTCFGAAREIEQVRAEIDAARQAAPAKKTRKAKRGARSPAQEGQLPLFEEAPLGG